MTYKIKNRAVIRRPPSPPPMRPQKPENEIRQTPDKSHVEGWFQEAESLSQMRLETQGIIDQIQTSMDRYRDRKNNLDSTHGRTKVEEDAILAIMSECKSKLVMLNKAVSVSYSFLTGLRPS